MDTDNYTHAHSHAHTYAHTHARAHAHTHTHTLALWKLVIRCIQISSHVYPILHNTYHVVVGEMEPLASSVAASLEAPASGSTHTPPPSSRTHCTSGSFWAVGVCGRLPPLAPSPSLPWCAFPDGNGTTRTRGWSRGTG